MHLKKRFDFQYKAMEEFVQQDDFDVCNRLYYFLKANNLLQKEKIKTTPSKELLGTKKFEHRGQLLYTNYRNLLLAQKDKTIDTKSPNEYVTFAHDNNFTQLPLKDLALEIPNRLKKLFRENNVSTLKDLEQTSNLKFSRYPKAGPAKIQAFKDYCSVLATEIRKAENKDGQIFHLLKPEIRLYNTLKVHFYNRSLAWILRRFTEEFCVLYQTQEKEKAAIFKNCNQLNLENNLDKDALSQKYQVSIKSVKSWNREVKTLHHKLLLQVLDDCEEFNELPRDLIVINSFNFSEKFHFDKSPYNGLLLILDCLGYEKFICDIEGLYLNKQLLSSYKPRILHYSKHYFKFLNYTNIWTPISSVCNALKSSDGIHSETTEFLIQLLSVDLRVEKRGDQDASEYRLKLQHLAKKGDKVFRVLSEGGSEFMNTLEIKSAYDHAFTVLGLRAEITENQVISAIRTDNRIFAKGKQGMHSINKNSDFRSHNAVLTDLFAKHNKPLERELLFNALKTNTRNFSSILNHYCLKLDDHLWIPKDWKKSYLNAVVISDQKLIKKYVNRNNGAIEKSKLSDYLVSEGKERNLINTILSKRTYLKAYVWNGKILVKYEDPRKAEKKNTILELIRTILQQEPNNRTTLNHLAQICYSKGFKKTYAYKIIEEENYTFFMKTENNMVELITMESVDFKTHSQ